MKSILIKDTTKEEREEIIDAYHELGLDVDVLLVSKSTTEECAQKISAADIIYETGGNLKFLTENWAAKGVNQMMHEAFERGAVLLGVSTGAMCWADRGWDNAEEPTFRITDSFPFFGKEAAYAYYNASGILNFSLCPHYDNIAWRIYDKKARKADAPSLCIENGVAVVFRNGKYETVLDKKTRKVYLYYPAKGIKKVDVTKDTTLLTITHYLQEQ